MKKLILDYLKSWIPVVQFLIVFLLVYFALLVFMYFVPISNFG